MNYWGDLKSDRAQDALGGESRLAFLFPGVGSEYTGMGRYVYDTFACAREVFEEASAHASLDVAQLCFSSEDSDRLSELANAKLAVVTTSVASSRVLMDEFGIAPDFCAGHSAGEYAALCSAGVLSLADTVALLRKRAEIIESVLREVSGRMAWAVNLTSDAVEEIVAGLQGEGHQVYVSAYDCPTQTSISTALESFPQCAAAVEAAGGMLIPINTSGPFHSPLMARARERYEPVLAACTFAPPKHAVLANVDARPYSGRREDAVERLASHLVKPVQWHATVAAFLENRVRYAIELGPKNILQFLLGKTTKDISSLSLDNENGWTSFRSDWLLDDAEVLQGIGKCLGAIASTRNGCSDLETYKAEVVSRIDALKSLHEDLRSGGTPVSKSHLGQAIGMTRSVLAAKRVPGPQIARRLTEILGPKLIDLRARRYV